MTLRAAQNVPRRECGTTLAVTSANGTPPIPPAVALIATIPTTTAATSPGSRPLPKSTTNDIARNARFRVVDVMR